MTWTRRDFIKVTGLSAGAVVLDLALPLPTICGSDEEVLSEEETIHTAFIGLGTYGREVGRLLSGNWRGVNPLPLHYINSEIKARNLEKILRGKELIFLACDGFDQAFKVARNIALAAEPFLLITLQPSHHPTHGSLQGNEGLLQAPHLDSFPHTWDPVSPIFGSLVNPGLIGVDLADLKSVVGNQTGQITVMQAEREFLKTEVENWIKYSLVQENKGNYLVIEQSSQENYDIELIHEIAFHLEKERVSQTGIYFTAAKRESILQYQFTMVQAV